MAALIFESRVRLLRKGHKGAAIEGFLPLLHQLPPLTKMKLYLLIVPFVALVATLLASTYHAMPATPGAAIATLHGTLGAITNATAGILASGRAVDDQDAADLVEALQLIESSESYLTAT